jgi:hypothetical protein
MVLQGGAAEADGEEEEERVPAPKGYNLDFLDNLDDPSFNPFQTKTAIKVKVMVELQCIQVNVVNQVPHLVGFVPVDMVEKYHRTPPPPPPPKKKNHKRQ